MAVNDLQRWGETVSATAETYCYSTVPVQTQSADSLAILILCNKEANPSDASDRDQIANLACSYGY